jgi:hypothetical protein
VNGVDGGLERALYALRADARALGVDLTDANEVFFKLGYLQGALYGMSSTAFEARNSKEN